MIRHCGLMVLLPPLLMGAATLPATGPLPAPRPDQAQATATTPETPPVPAEKPQDGQPGDDTQKPDAAAEDDAKEKRSAAIEAPPAEDPDELKACLAELTALGTKFTAIDAINDGNGCGIASPIRVDEALPGLALGGAVMRCETALATAKWLKLTVQPALELAKPGRRITQITPGSTYACRLRNNAGRGKISEHARGNGLDVAAFGLDDGSKIEMKPRAEDSTLEGAFQRTATSGACLHFTTVLAPGSDAAHMDHLHLDIIERRNGYRYCR